jgi:hypothetical protein
MKIAVLLPHRSDVRSRREAVDVLRALDRQARIHAPTDRLVLGVPETTRGDAVDETGVRVREFRIRSIDGERIRTLEAIGGWEQHHFPDRGVYFRDGIADFADCDVWLLLAPTGVDEDGSITPILKLRPSVVAPTTLPGDDTAWAELLGRLHEVRHG